MLLQSLVRRLFALMGILLFLGMFVFPFMSYSPIPILRPLTPERLCGHRIELWSFMMRDTVVCLERFDGRFSRSIYDYYFFDYWFRSLWYCIDFRDDLQQQAVKNEIASILISLFVVQAATSIAATMSIFINKKIVYLTPVFLCLITVLLMISTFTLLNQKTYNKFNYELGYWLTYPSEALFIANMLIRAKFTHKITNKT
jgi:hypothetical protein